MAKSFYGVDADDNELILFWVVQYNYAGPFWRDDKSWMPFQYRNAVDHPEEFGYGTHLGMFTRANDGKWVLEAGIPIADYSLYSYPNTDGGVFYVCANRDSGTGTTKVSKFNFTTSAWTTETLPDYGANTDTGATGVWTGMQAFTVIADGHYLLTQRGRYTATDPDGIAPSQLVLQPVCLEYVSGAWRNHGRVARDAKYLEIQKHIDGASTYNGIYQGNYVDTIVADGADDGKVYYITSQQRQFIAFPSANQEFQVVTELDYADSTAASWRTLVDVTFPGTQRRQNAGYYTDGMLVSPLTYLGTDGSTVTAAIHWVTNLSGTATRGMLTVDSWTLTAAMSQGAQLVFEAFSGTRDEMVFVYPKTQNFEFLEYWYATIDTTVPAVADSPVLYIRTITLTDDEDVLPPGETKQMFWEEGFAVGESWGVPPFDLLVIGEGMVEMPDGSKYESCAVPIYFGANPPGTLPEPPEPPEGGPFPWSYLGRSAGSFSGHGGPYSILAYSAN